MVNLVSYLFSITKAMLVNISKTHLSLCSWFWGLTNLPAQISATSSAGRVSGLNSGWLVCASMCVCVGYVSSKKRGVGGSPPKVKHGSGHQLQEVKQQDFPTPTNNTHTITYLAGGRKENTFFVVLHMSPLFPHHFNCITEAEIRGLFVSTTKHSSLQSTALGWENVRVKLTAGK